MGQSGRKWENNLISGRFLPSGWGILEQMFLGEYVHAIDSKGRLTIPSKFRAELASGLVITRWLDPCLVIYPMAAWHALTQKVSALPMSDRTARDFRRLVYANASDTVPDSVGRINIPVPLRQYASLGDSVIVVGCDTYIEIWDPDAWAEVRARVENSDENAERWASLGI